VLTIYRRHVTACPHRSEGRKYRRCHCPVWADGFLGREETRKSLGTRNWEKGQEVIREWEAQGSQGREPEPITINQAWDEFLSDAQARNLEDRTLYKYCLLSRQMLGFAEGHGIRFLRELDLPMLRRFRATWPDQNLGALKKLERLRAFFRFACDAKWVDGNTARKLESPKVQQRPTMPFAEEEMIRIYAACDKYSESAQRIHPRHVLRLKALVLLLRHSGLRIGDAVTLSRDRIVNGKLFLYTAKAGTPVYCPLPPLVLQALEAAAGGGHYFFWTGESKPESAAGNWRRALSRVFRLAEIRGAHPHRFRDTFAVGLLLAGVPMEHVSILLGHQSLKVTERYYAPWVRARQEQLESDLRRSWGETLVTVRDGKGTPEVHSGKPLVN
jgi:integrase/recombinase XerD